MSEAASLFVAVRPHLFGIAHRILGSAGEAEDIVQKAWIRWQNCDRGKVRDARAFLATTTARLSCNAVQSARARHETHPGRRQPEPVDTGATPERAAEHREALRLALRVTLEKLSPRERAAYVLRQAFDYPYEQIAAITQQTQTSVRQHVSRARKRLSGAKRAAVDAGRHRQLLDAFVAGAQHGNLAALERLLAADILRDHGEARVTTGPIRAQAASMHAGDILTLLRRHDIPCSIDSFAAQGWTAKLGDSAKGFYAQQARFPTIDAAARWLLEEAKRHYPDAIPNDD